MSRIKEIKKVKMIQVLVIGTSALIIVLLTVQGVILSISISDIVMSEVYDTSAELLEQKNIRLNDRFNEIRQVALSIALNEEIVNNLSKAKDMEFYEQVVFVRNVNQFFSTTVNTRKDISQIVIINDDLYVNNYNNSNGIVKSSFIKNQELLDKLAVDSDGIIATQANYLVNDSSVKDVVTYYRHLYDRNQEFIGILCILINEVDVRNFVENKTKDSGDITLLLDENRELISPYSKAGIEEYQKLIDKSSNTFFDENAQESMTYSLDDENFFVIETNSDQYNYRLIQLKPYSEINKSVRILVSNVTKVGIIGGIIAIALLYFFSKSITKPIRKLLFQMKNVGNDNFKIDTDLGYISEMNELNSGFESMTRRIKLLIQEVDKKHQKMRMAELNALQSQINPHFLYNTLDAINWMAIRLKANDISQMVSNLGGFFRLGLNNGSDFTTIGKEIEHLRLYMKIQAVRYNNRFDFIEDYDEDLHELRTIKLILQPLVENALIHGLGINKGEGIIRIIARRQNDVVRFIVWDDGQGANPDEMNAILRDDKIVKEGYGIRNVNSRIQICYGEQFGLKYLDVDKGTKVQVTVPAIEDVRKRKELER